MKNTPQDRMLIAKKIKQPNKEMYISSVTESKLITTEYRSFIKILVKR